jgi:hypothetical protein
MSLKKQSRSNDKTQTASKSSQPATESPELTPQQPNSNNLISQAERAPRSLSAQNMLQLQRMTGNRAVNKLISKTNAGPVIQPKLTVGAAHDPYEQEAERVAAQVVASPTPDLSLQRTGSDALPISPAEQPIAARAVAPVSQPVIQRATHNMTGGTYIARDNSTHFRWAARATDGFYHLVSNRAPESAAVGIIANFLSIPNMHIHVVGGEFIVTIEQRGVGAGADYGHWHYRGRGQNFVFDRPGSGNLTRDRDFTRLAGIIMEEFAKITTCGGLTCSAPAIGTSLNDMAANILRAQREDEERRQREEEERRRREEAEREPPRREKKEKKHKKHKRERDSKTSPKSKIEKSSHKHKEKRKKHKKDKKGKDKLIEKLIETKKFEKGDDDEEGQGGGQGGLILAGQ